MRCFCNVAALSHSDKFSDQIALVGLCLLSFGHVPSKAMANLGLALLLVSFIIKVPTRWKFLFEDNLMRLSIIWMIWCTGLAIWATFKFPGTSQFSGLKESWAFAFIPLVASATYGNTRKVICFGVLALVGLIIRLLMDINLGDGPIFDYETDVVALGYARNTAVLAINVGILGCIALLLSIAGMTTWTRSVRSGLIVLLSTCLLLLLNAWISAPSRISLVTLPIVVAIQILFAWPKKKIITKSIRNTILSVAFATLAVIGLNAEKIMSRLSTDQTTWSAIATGNLSNVALDSTGQRIHMWRLAYEQWIAHPWTGTGTSVQHFLKSAQGQPFLNRYTHFHSTYIEALLRVGLVGVAVYLVASLIIANSIRTSLAVGNMPRLMGGFFIASFCTFFSLNSTESILYFQRGWQFVALFGGFAYGYEFMGKITKASSDPFSEIPN